MLLGTTIVSIMALSCTATILDPAGLKPMNPSVVGLGNPVQKQNLTQVLNYLPQRIYTDVVKYSESSILKFTWSYHIPDTTLKIYVMNIGSPLPIADINACLASLSMHIIRQILIHGDSPAARPVRTWHHGLVDVSFDPRGITWDAAGEVVDALERIIDHDKWTFASYVRVEDEREGLKGYLSITHHRALRG